MTSSSARAGDRRRYDCEKVNLEPEREAELLRLARAADGDKPPANPVDRAVAFLGARAARRGDDQYTLDGRVVPIRTLITEAAARGCKGLYYPGVELHPAQFCRKAAVPQGRVRV